MSPLSAAKDAICINWSACPLSIASRSVDRIVIESPTLGWKGSVLVLDEPPTAAPDAGDDEVLLMTRDALVKLARRTQG